eukprot:3696-Heterococcus_DN1.PRE.1
MSVRQSQLENALAAVTAERNAVAKERDDYGATSQEHGQTLASAQAQVARLQQELDHRAAEADIIKASRASQEKELEDHKQRLTSARDQLFELQGSSAAALQEVGALRRENATHTSNLKDLAAELNTRTEELLEARRSHSAAVFGLKTKLTGETEKARQLEESVSRLEKQLSTRTAALSERNASFASTPEAMPRRLLLITLTENVWPANTHTQAEAKLRTLQQEVAKDKSLMENELATATRMVELLQRHLKDAEDRVAQAESARDAASKRAADAKAQAETERSRSEAAVAA